jgi:hypothetical protein
MPKARTPKPPSGVIQVRHPSDETGELRFVGGSASDDFNTILANQVTNALWLARADEDERQKRMSAAVAGLAGIAPRDELEGMLGAQLIAAHSAAMECYRRVMIPDQTFEGHRESLTQANKLSRTYVTLLEALNRHRGKGQQKVTVEHVHVHPGGQAIVGAVEASASGSGGGGGEHKGGGQPRAKTLEHASQPAMWCENPKQEPMPRARDAEREVPHARRRVTRRTQG